VWHSLTSANGYPRGNTVWLYCRWMLTLAFVSTGSRAFTHPLRTVCVQRMSAKHSYTVVTAVHPLRRLSHMDPMRAGGRVGSRVPAAACGVEGPRRRPAAAVGGAPA
jgi:hypothetical protein